MFIYTYLYQTKPLIFKRLVYIIMTVSISPEICAFLIKHSSFCIKGAWSINQFAHYEKYIKTHKLINLDNIDFVVKKSQDIIYIVMVTDLVDF